MQVAGRAWVAPSTSNFTKIHQESVLAKRTEPWARLYRNPGLLAYGEKPWHGPPREPPPAKETIAPHPA
jgi:hypothetical protein